MYYTFRCIGENLFEVTKWEEHRSMPLDTYEVQWRKHQHSAKMCTCPARVPCRHLKMLAEALESPLRLFELIYQEDVGIVQVFDQKEFFYAVDQLP